MKKLISKFLSRCAKTLFSGRNEQSPSLRSRVNSANFLTRRSVFRGLLWFALWAVCISIVAIILSSVGLTDRIELATFDWRFRIKQIMGQTLRPSEEIVLVAINEESALSLNPRIPTPRDYLSELINFLSEAGAKLIVLDVLLDNATSPAADAALADAIKKAGNVILPCELTGENFDKLKPLYGDFAQNAADIGFAGVYHDADNYIRRMPISIRLRQLNPRILRKSVDAESRAIFSLPVAIYAKYRELQEGEQIVPADILSDILADENGSFLINFAGEAGTFARYPSRLFFIEPKPPAIIFRDKIVLIGATHRDIRDSYLLTPFYSTLQDSTPRYMPGVEIIANALNTLVNRSFIRQMNPLLAHLIAFALIILALMMLFRVHPVKGVLVVVCSISFWWVFSFMLFTFFDYSLIVMQPTIGFSLAYVLAILRSFSREEREKRRFEAEIKAAREVQQQLLPKSPPEIDELDIAAICLPQREVGGDYFDYIWLDEDRKKFGIVIADVQGKGLKAAMTASLASGMLNAVLGEDDCSTGDILSRLNELLYRRMARRTSVCFALAVFDLVKGQVKLSIAGLPEPILKQESNISSLSPDGNRFPLGCTPRGEYQELIKELPEGSTLVFYTDGIPEAMNSNGELYGFDRFEEAVRGQKHTLNAQGFLDALLSNVKQFAGKAPQDDDLTLIVVKNSGAPVKGEQNA